MEQSFVKKENKNRKKKIKKILKNFFYISYSKRVTKKNFVDQKRHTLISMGNPIINDFASLANHCAVQFHYIQKLLEGECRHHEHTSYPETVRFAGRVHR